MPSSPTSALALAPASAAMPTAALAPAAGLAPTAAPLIPSALPPPLAPVPSSAASAAPSGGTPVIVVGEVKRTASTALVSEANTTNARDGKEDPINNLDIKAINKALVDGATQYLSEHKKAGDDGKSRAAVVKCFAIFLQAAAFPAENSTSTTTNAAPDAKSDPKSDQTQKVFQKYILLLFLAVKGINTDLFNKYIKPKLANVKLEKNESFLRSYSSSYQCYPTKWLEKNAFAEDAKQVSSVVNKLKELLNSNKQQPEYRHLTDMISFFLAEEWQRVIKLPAAQREAAVEQFNIYWEVCQKHLVNCQRDEQTELDKAKAAVDEKAAAAQRAENEREAQSIAAAAEAKAAVTGIGATTTAVPVAPVPAKTESGGSAAGIPSASEQNKYFVSTIATRFRYPYQQADFNIWKSYEFIASCIAIGLSDYLSKNKNAVDKKHIQAILKLVTKFQHSPNTPSGMLVLLFCTLVHAAYLKQNHNGSAVLSVVYTISHNKAGLPPQKPPYASFINYFETRYGMSPMEIIVSEFLLTHSPKDSNFYTSILADAIKLLEEDPENQDQFIAKLEDALSGAYLKLIAARTVDAGEKIAYLRNFVEHIKVNKIGNDPASRNHMVRDPTAEGVLPSPAFPTPNAPGDEDTIKPQTDLAAAAPAAAAAPGQAPPPVAPLPLSLAAAPVAVADPSALAPPAAPPAVVAATVTPASPPPSYTGTAEGRPAESVAASDAKGDAVPPPEYSSSEGSSAAVAVAASQAEGTPQPQVAPIAMPQLSAPAVPNSLSFAQTQQFWITAAPVAVDPNEIAQRTFRQMMAGQLLAIAQLESLDQTNSNAYRLLKANLEMAMQSHLSLSQGSAPKQVVVVVPAGESAPKFAYVPKPP